MKSSNDNLQLAKKPMVSTPVKVAPVVSSHHHHNHVVEDDNVVYDDSSPQCRSNSIHNSLSRHNSFNQQSTTSTTNNTAGGGGGGGAESNNSNNNSANTTVDFIGPSNAVKHLFSLPYNNDRNVSVALHNVGNGTLLLDSGGEDFGGLPSAAAESNVGRSGGTRGRRRARPRSWSIKEEHASSSANDDNDDDDDVDSNHQLQLLREGERSLFSSLSLLLEEEKKQQRPQASADDGEIIPVVSPSPSQGGEDDKKKTKGNENNALVVPSKNAIVVSSEGSPSSEHEPIVSSASNTTTSHAPKNTHHNSRLDPNDPLLKKLPSPQQYLSHVVSPPSEPRQYVDWKFHDMKLLIASDAVIYNHEEATAGGQKANNSNDYEGGTKVGTNGTSNVEDKKVESISIRVADASDLKSQMKYHENMVKPEGLYYKGNMNRRRALPPSSYAEALLTPSPDDEEEDDDGIGNNVKLQTCIIPASGVGPEWANEWAHLGYSLSPSCPPTVADNNNISAGNAPSGGVNAAGECAATSSSPLPFSSSPVCTVLDAYLDNIMANVPQLALILREHGFVQNIKLLRTEDIPSLMMHPSTLGADDSSSSHNAPSSSATPVFSPDIVEMNGAMLLRFLKTNCTRENSTYLLHRAAGDTNIQLFDITSISELRQRKWVWWLALCSYRFACRLEQLQTNVLSPHDKVTRREYRSRQRSLLHNTLNLLEELADMGGGRHDTIGAAVCEHLADTYLWNDEADGDVGVRDSTKPAPCASSSQPYRKVTVDCLNKAHDHLMNGIKKLTPLLSKAKKEEKSSISIEIEAISTQLYGIHHKIVNVNLRLADHHLQNYFSSNLIQSLRTAARMLSDATSLLEPLDIFEFRSQTAEKNDSHLYGRSILLQYAWLWEYCGHFARSFAADGLWRDRGHTCGADLIGLFTEVNGSCSSIMKKCFGAAKWKSKTSVGAASHGQVSLNSLCGIVVLPEDFELIEASVLRKEGCHEAIGAAKSILGQKTQIKRDALLVLVAASVSYGHAIDSYLFLADHNREDGNQTQDSTAKKESVDGLNLISMTPGTKVPNEGSLTSGATVAPLLRQRLGDACNEIGKILLNESRAVLLAQFSPPENVRISNNSFGMSHVSAIMLASAQFWFLEGLEQFSEGKDLRNLALLRCNLCQVCKIRANTNVILPGTSAEENKSESYLQEAVDHLVSAHEAMGEREGDPVTWDMVSEELAATLLVLGVRRRQSALSSSSEPLLLQAMRLTPGAEKSIIEPMERSCQIYKSLGTARASHQAAAAHYQLALYFSKVWTCQRDEVKTREKLGAAFKHYGLAHRYFFQHIQGHETTFIILSLDFSNLYSSTMSGEECLSKALMCCLDTRMAFSLSVAPSAVEQITTLADSVEARVSKLLLSLVKIEKENNSKLKAGQKPSEKYKNMYRKVLGYKMTAGNVEPHNHCENNENPTLQLFELLKTLNDLSKA